MVNYIGVPPTETPSSYFRVVYTNTLDGQTHFAGMVYQPGFLDVWHNGSKLTPGVEFTATDGTTFDLIGGLVCVAGDEVQGISIGSYSIPDAFTQAQSDAKYAAKTGTSFTGAVNTSRAVVASHATTANIWAAAGNTVSWTGIAICTDFPAAPQAGASRKLICSDAAQFTAGANMLINGYSSGQTVTLAANDIVVVEAITTTQFLLNITRYSAGYTKYAVIVDSKASAVSGGTFTLGAWRTRDLNTKLYDPYGIVTISSNQFTLEAGTYLIEWSAPAHGVENNQTCLYDVTNTTIVMPGTSQYSSASYLASPRSEGAYGVTLLANTTFEVRHYSSGTYATSGFGIGSSTGINNHYTMVKITK